MNEMFTLLSVQYYYQYNIYWRFYRHRTWLIVSS